jgi:hypothetical protein
MSTGVLLFRLTYVSRSTFRTEPARLDAEVTSILASSRRNNRENGITGALLFNAECFAQTLEGELEHVHATFERIQCDPRHRGTVVLPAGPAAQREFGGWSMAYAGRLDDTSVRFTHVGAEPDPFARTQNAEAILALMRGVALRSELV